MRRSLLLFALGVMSVNGVLAQPGWTPLANTSLVGGGVCPPGVAGSCTNVIEAWSGAAWDSLRGRMLLFGGGHADYAGNEVYAVYPPGSTLPVGVTCSSVTAPAICRIKDPSASLRSLAGACFSLQADGINPTSRHSYQSVLYIPQSDRLFMGGGSVACALGSHPGDTFTLPLTSLGWEARDPANRIGTWVPRDVCNMGGGCTFNGQGPYVHVAYDPVSQLVYREEAGASNGAVANGMIWTYNESTNTYRLLGNGYSFWDHMTWVVDPKRRRLYMIGNAASSNGGDSGATSGTPLIRYLDISNTTTYPTTTVNPGAHASCNGLFGALNPGLDYDPVLDRIVGWPNFGNTVYIYDPDTNTCTTQTFPNGPPDSRNAVGAVYTTGTFGRFKYMKHLNAYMVVNDGATNAYMLRLADSNFITLTNPGSSAATFPVQIGRPFAEGELANGLLPQAFVGGSGIPTQVDVKSRWSDGSLKHAVISFVSPVISAGGSTRVSFSPGVTVGNTALTQAQMLSSGYNFDAVISLSKAGVTKTSSARTMLCGGDCASPTTGDYTLWTSGPIATTVLLGNYNQGYACSGGTPSFPGATTSKYDFGFDSFCAFRPLFYATFWPGQAMVKVRFIGEIANTEQLEDVAVDILTLTAGSSAPVTVHNQSSLTMYMGSRWTRTGWIGGTAPVFGINHNLAYLTYTKAIPNYDTSKNIPAATVTSAYTTWTNANKNLYDAGEWQKVMSAAGGRPDIGPYPSWVVRWLYTGDYRMQEEALGNADLATAWPVHYREGKTNKFLDRALTVSGLGRVLSISTRPTLCYFCGSTMYNYGSTAAADRITPVGTVTPYNSLVWKPDDAHQPDAFSVPFTVTGDFFYWEEMAFLASWAAGTPGINTVGYNGRGPTGAEGGLPGFGVIETRGQGWAFRNRAQTAWLTPDAFPEKAYFETLIGDAIAIWEGQRNITGTAYQGNSRWNWGNLVGINLWSPLGIPALHFWEPGDAVYASQYPIDSSVTSIGHSPWEINFVIYSLGRAKELGYATDDLLTWVAPMLVNQVVGTGYNPWLVGAYRLPTQAVATNNYFTTWAGVKSGFVTAAQNGTSFAPMWSGGDCTGNASDCYAYFAAAAMSLVADQASGAEAWAWTLANIQSRSATQSEPKWAIIPRADYTYSASPPPSPCVITPTGAGPFTAGQVVSVTFTATNCASSTWTATGLTGSGPPSGLSINPTTGVLSGTAVAGSYAVTINYDTAGVSFTLQVAPAAQLDVFPLPSPVKR